MNDKPAPTLEQAKIRFLGNVGCALAAFFYSAAALLFFASIYLMRILY